MASVPALPLSSDAASGASPQQLRLQIRTGGWDGPTSGLAPGYAQANMVVLPRSQADDFAAFCKANAQPCPVLERLPDGAWHSQVCAPGADLRTDLPRYQVFEEGRLIAEPGEVTSWWSEAMTAFLIGCSFSFEHALQAAGIRMAHIDQGRNVSMYHTRKTLVPVGPFGGHLVVSMRWIADSLVETAVRITARYPRLHGAPVAVGDPGVLGIEDLAHPDYGDAVTRPPGTTPVFWACGVTTQVAALAPGRGRIITHAPGHMLLLDLPHEAFFQEGTSAHSAS